MAYTDADLQADLAILKNNPQTGLVVRQTIADIAEKLVEVYLTNTEQFSDMKDAVNAILGETFDSAALETMIAEKLAAKEIEYAPKLTEVTAQLTQNTNELVFSSYETGGVVTIIDDDGHGQFLSKAKPVLDNNNVKATLCVAASEVGKAGIMTVEQLKSLESEGYEVASHGTAGRLADMSSELEMISDLETARNFVEQHKFKARDILVYNGGNWSNASGRTVKKLVRRYFKYAFNSFGDNNLYVDNFQIGRVDFNAKTLAELKVLVDECASNKIYLVLMVHSWDSTFDATKLDTIIKYIKAANVKILKATEAVKLKANYVDYGDPAVYGGFRLDAQGRMSANIFKADATNINKSIIEYPFGSSLLSLDSFVAGTIPIPSGLKDYAWAGYGGRIKVMKESATVCYQNLFLNYSKILRYTRKWDNTAKTWTAFVPDFSYIHIGATSNADCRKSIVNYDQKMMTEFTVTSGANTPESSAGVIQVHRGSDDAYSYMEFTKANDSQTYKSTWNGTSSTWNPWIGIDTRTWGGGAPTSTPAYVGQRYLDTANKILYFAFGTVSSADWVAI